MRLLWSLICLICVASAKAFIADALDGWLLEERTSHLAKRSGPKCGPNLATSVGSKRRVGFIRFERNATVLEKRMQLPRSMGAFYDNEWPERDDEVVPHEEAKVPEDMSTGIMKIFSDLPADKGYSTGTILSGCTALYIISRKGVYAVHWWENISFAPDLVWLESGATSEELFQRTVIDMLKNGGKFHPKLDATLIEDDSIKAYLMRPNEAWDGGTYDNQWQQIRTTVGELVPTLQDQSRWTEIIYTPLRDQGLYYKRRPFAGRSLFKFDPVHDFGQGKKGPLAMLWAEDQRTPYHKDQW